MLEAVRKIIDDGVYFFEEILDNTSLNDLYNKMINEREFGANLFQSEDEYNKQNNHFNTNPSPDFNFLNQFSDELQLVEKNEKINQLISELLGDDYEIVIKKLVCGVPKSWLPDWVDEKIKDVNVANLGPYIKKEFRDITYFRGIDFHQDIIDWPKGKTDLDPAKFITLYVYIHDVGAHDSPLHVIPKSHQFGATLFPHKLKKLTDNTWCYQDDNSKEIICEDIVLTGRAGYTALWHNCTLHGTQPVQHESEKFRISLRYLIGKSKKNHKTTAIDEINKKISGDLQPIRTRYDVDNLGKVKMKGNIINES